MVLIRQQIRGFYDSLHGHGVGVRYYCAQASAGIRRGLGDSLGHAQTPRVLPLAAGSFLGSQSRRQSNAAELILVRRDLLQIGTQLCLAQTTLGRPRASLGICLLLLLAYVWRCGTERSSNPVQRGSSNFESAGIRDIAPWRQRILVNVFPL